jgi:hypothetical protein
MEWAAVQGKSLDGITCSESRCSGPNKGTNKGTNMHSIVGRLILWFAEYLDRSLITVPDLDD